MPWCPLTGTEKPAGTTEDEFITIVVAINNIKGFGRYSRVLVIPLQV